MKTGTHFIFLTMLVVALLTNRAQAFAEEPPSNECTAGVADGEVTVDGRPLLWKLRNQSDATNDVHYFASGMEHYPGLGPATYSYLGMGTADDAPEGPVRQGLNSQGLAVGWNALGTGGWQQLHHQALGHYNTISQVRTYVNEMTNLSTYNYFIDVSGEAALWENRFGMGQHWEYNTRAPARDSQWIDVDNADGDDDYSTGVDVMLSGWAVRANAPGHFNVDGTDDLGNTGRYKAGRDVTGALIYNSGHGTALSAKSIATSFFRHDTLAMDDTVSNMIVHGVLPTEDPRLTTMWTLLGHSETGIFVPVWIHGVESGGLNEVPQYLDSGDDGVCAYDLAKGMHNAGFNEANVQARTLPFEEHLFDVVNDKLLPEWRNQDWTDSTAVAVIGEEMKRVQEQMDADAYRHLKYLHDNGATSNYAPTVSIDSATHNWLEVTFSVTADDADGSELTYLFNYGDGQIGSSATHEYPQAGRYLVSCTVTDENGVSQTDWFFTTISSSVNLPPTATITQPADGAAFIVGQSIFYAGDGTDLEDGLLPASAFTWSVSINGGSFQPLSTGAKSGSGVPPVVGNYVIRLTVEDSEGLTDSDDVTVTVSSTTPNQPPTAVAEADPTSGSAPLTVAFTGSHSFDSDGTITDYSWDFGDGNTSTQPDPIHVFQVSGTYTVVLVVTDDGEPPLNGEAEIAITVFTAPDTSPPYATNHSPAPGETGIPLNTLIALEVRDEEAGVDQATIAMRVSGSSVTPSVSGAPAAYSITYDPPVDFGYEETVSVEVDASDLAGNTMVTHSYSFTTISSSVNLPPTATITQPADGAAFIVGQSIFYAGDGTDLEDGLLPASAFTWSVSINGGSFQPLSTGAKSGSGVPPVVGNYVIRLTVEDSEGLTDSDEITIIVGH